MGEDFFFPLFLFVMENYKRKNTIFGWIKHIILCFISLSKNPTK